jgi:N-acyl-D-aspartate/D-glutamate deacylase
MTLDSRIHPLVSAPSYRKLARLPLAARAAELARPEVRAAILDEIDPTDRATTPLANFAYAFVLEDPPRYDQAPDESLAAIARRAGRPVVEVAYDVLLANDGTGAIYAPATNFVDGNLDAVREMLVHPLTVPGLGDAGAHCTAICDGSFPTYLLSYWGRDAPEEQRLPVEWVVKRQCADTARLVGLDDRGVLAPGQRADVNLVDLDTLAIDAPQMVFDLPAGGRRLVQRASGYRRTIVSGVTTFVDGEPTGSLPGRLVRGG